MPLHDITPPIEFSGPAQLVLFTRYGDPRDAGFEQKWMTTWDVSDIHPWFPEKNIYIHKHFWPMLDAAFKNLVKRDLHHAIRTFDGCYEMRHLKGSTGVLSVHSWGAAIDLNAKDNMLGSAGSWDSDFLKAMTDAGVYCGQNWDGRKDPMHFAMVNG